MPQVEVLEDLIANGKLPRAIDLDLNKKSCNMFDFILL